MYAQDNGQFIPAIDAGKTYSMWSTYATFTTSDTPLPTEDWFTYLIPDYIANGKVFFCPSTGHDGRTYYYIAYSPGSPLWPPYDSVDSSKSFRWSARRSIDYSYYGDNPRCTGQTGRKIMSIGDQPTLRIVGDVTYEQCGWAPVQVWNTWHNGGIRGNEPYWAATYGSKPPINHISRQVPGYPQFRKQGVTHTLHLDGHVEGLPGGKMQYIENNDYTQVVHSAFIY
jgi:hypothetical protein